MARRRHQEQRKRRKGEHIKKYIELLASNPDPVLNLSLLKAAPDDVIKIICNAAYNLTNNKSIKLTSGKKRFFKKYKVPITKLIQPGPSIKQKRRLLVQRGGGLFTGVLLGTVLPIVTSLIGGLATRVLGGGVDNE